MLFEIMAVVKAMQLSIMGPGLALRGACVPAHRNGPTPHASHRPFFHACVPGGNSWILCTILYLVGPEGSMTRAVLVMRGEYRTVCFHPFISLD